MALQCGIVGLPNVGKSTIFNALTKTHGAEAANYPFCTIDPNVGVVTVPDERFTWLVENIKPKSAIPASVEFVDIAGLVKGASQGEGLGNQFLSHIRQVDAILHIVRCFEDENISHVHGEVNPEEDIAVIELELIFADLEVARKRYEGLKKKIKGGDKEAKSIAEVLEKVIPHLEKNQPAISLDLNKEEKKLIKDLNLLTLKPVLFVGNVEEAYAATPEQSVLFQKLLQAAQKRGVDAVAVSGKIEQEISQLEGEEEIMFLQELGLKESGLNRVIRKAYDLLGYITFFTAGEPEVRAWNIVKGTLAPQAAGVIHSDIERGFIRAEVTSFEDVKKYGGLKAAQEAGKMRLEGKEYEVQDGDVIYFRFAV
ncbi:MAG: redox-regulated ATPase YchF [Candidatus Hydrogenedentota bacterium]|nr:MAG: redox-regulated ATPase YchF [Candidatus Hydrogenedentota bacterium]